MVPLLKLAVSACALASGHLLLGGRRLGRNQSSTTSLDHTDGPTIMQLLLETEDLEKQMKGLEGKMITEGEADTLTKVKTRLQTVAKAIKRLEDRRQDEAQKLQTEIENLFELPLESNVGDKRKSSQNLEPSQKMLVVEPNVGVKRPSVEQDVGSSTLKKRRLRTLRAVRDSEQTNKQTNVRSIISIDSPDSSDSSDSRSADGCLFCALAEGSSTGHLHGTALTEAADDLRDRVVVELVKRREEYEDLINAVYPFGFDDYVQRLHRLDTRAGEIELMLASHVLCRPVKVWRAEEEEWYEESARPDSGMYGSEYASEGGAIHLMLEGGKYYPNLFVKEQLTPSPRKS